MAAAEEGKLFALHESTSPGGQAPVPSNLFALPQMDEREIQMPEPIVFGDQPQEAPIKPN